MKILPKVCILFTFLTTALASGSGLKTGPMVGAAQMKEVLLWVQTDGPAEVFIEYREAETTGWTHRTDPVATRKEDGFVARLVADAVMPDRHYYYRVLVNGHEFRPQSSEGRPLPADTQRFRTPPNWRFRESGHEVADFTFGFGSCAYINQPEGGYDRLGGKPYGADYRIFESIHAVNPDFFVWLGDNIYYREPDWTSRRGMIERWTHDRAIPEMRAFLASRSHFATWDDHDYGPNDAGREYWNRAAATEVFQLFHANPPPANPEKAGIATYFSWSDVHFYLLDNRSFRTVPGVRPEPFGYERQQLGKAQIDWLVELMIFNREQSRSSYPSTFHVVGLGSQVMSPHSRDSLPHYPLEWQYLFDRLVHAEMHNVLFITGDVHYGEVSRLVYPGGGKTGVPGKFGEPGMDYIFWDITSSPMTAGPWAGAEPERNPHRFDIFPGEADRVGQRNFATLSFEGPLHARRAVIRYFDSDGRLLNQQPGAADGTPTPESVITARHLNLHPSLMPKNQP